MASTPLRLFPTVSAEPPLRSALKKPQSSSSKKSQGHLNGVAVQVTANSKPKPPNTSAPQAIQHSLFCDPSPEILASISKDSSDSPSTDSNASFSSRSPQSETRMRQPKRRVSTSPLTGSEISFTSEEEDPKLSFISSNSNHPTNPPARERSLRSKHSQCPGNILSKPRSYPSLPRLGSLAENEQAVGFEGGKTKVMRSASASRSATSTASRSSRSFAQVSEQHHGAPPQSANDSQPMQSMFPQYDHTKSLNQQQYYPKVHGPSPVATTRSSVSRWQNPIVKRTLQHHDSAVALVNGYEHVSTAEPTDMHDIWKASCEELPVTGRKVQLGLHQFSAQGTALAIGRSPSELIYSMDRMDTQTSQQNPSQPKEMAIKKHHPTQKSSLPVAHLLLPDRSLVRTTEKRLTSIFPQAAAIDAIEALLTTPQAQEHASFKESAHSPVAAQFAHDAIGAAKRQHACDLVRKARRRDSLGSVTAAYDLRHPGLGNFVIAVSKSYSPAAPTVPRAKISLHHPSATPTAIAAETLNLAFLDFASDACVLDLPGLLALDDHYVIDTVITALLAVAVIENDALVAESLIFDAPPKVAVGDNRKKQHGCGQSEELVEKKSSLRRRGRKSKKAKKSKTTDGEEIELPAVTQGALALLGFSLKAAVLLLNAGVKVTAGVVVGVSNAARKL